MKNFEDLSRRERQIMEIVYRLGKATSHQIQEEMTAPPSYAAVRRLIAILEEKSFLQHEKCGTKFIFSPTIDRETASRRAVKRLARTYFNDSPLRAFAAFIDSSDSDLSREDLEKLSRMIETLKRKEMHSESDS